MDSVTQLRDIWQESGKYFASHVQILDFYHASEHLWNVGRAWHGDKTEANKKLAKDWVHQQQERLLGGKASEVIASVQSWEPVTTEGSDIKRREAAYFQQHQSCGRLDYPRYLSAGYHIGSGVIEAGCKNVVQSRMKGAGMRWGLKGAESMLHMRALWCSQRQIDFNTPARAAVMMA